jgi:hypothetical protein
MIQLDLKSKHYYLIANILFEFAAYASFSTLEKIKNECNGVGDDDLVTVESDVDTITSVFQVLSQKPEGSYNTVNSEMLDLLTPQITAGVNAGDPEWIKLGQNVSQIRDNNFAVITNAINNGKARLYI